MKNIFLIALTLFFFSCQDNPEFLGNSLQDQYGPLNFTEEFKSSATEFDFSQPLTNYFEAKWSKNLNWELTLTGENSGAVKTFTGFGTELTSAESTWIGTANNFPSFDLEECVAELKLTDLDTTIMASIFVTLSSLKPQQNDLFLVTDFENGLVNMVPYEQPGANMTFDLEIGGAASGNQYYSMGGYVNWDYYLGSIKILTDVSAMGSVPPSSAYFNIATLGGIINETPDDQFVEIVCRESDGDLFSTTIRPVTWSNWNLTSLPYSDFVLVDGSQGDNIQDPASVMRVEVVCLSCPAGPSPINDIPPCEENLNLNVKTDIDFIAFTLNEPYNP
jgi:hypothetical protein